MNLVKRTPTKTNVICRANEPDKTGIVELWESSKSIIYKLQKNLPLTKEEQAFAIAIPPDVLSKFVHSDTIAPKLETFSYEVGTVIKVNLTFKD